MEDLKPAFQVYVIQQGYILHVTEQEVLKNFSKKDLESYIETFTKQMDVSADEVMSKIYAQMEEETPKSAHCNDNVFFFKNWMDVVTKMTDYIPQKVAQPKASK